MNEVINFFRKDSIYFYLTILIVVTLFFPMYIFNSIAILSLVAIWFLKGDYKNISKIKENKIVIIFLLLYISFIIGTIYTENFKGALNILRMRLPMLVFPLIYASIDGFSVKQTKIFKRIFIIVTLISCLYSHINIFIDWSISDNPFIDIMRSYKYSYSYITDYLDLHPTYFSYLIIISLIFLENMIAKTKSIKNKLVGIIIGLYLIIFLIHVASKIALIGLFMLFLFFIIKNIYQRKFVLSFILIVGLIVGGSVASKFDFTVKRYKQVINIFIPQKGVVHSTAGYRLFAFNAFKKEFVKSPIFGVGLANGNKYLDIHFETIGFPHMKGKNYHNQYLQILIELGIFGFLIFILNFLIPLRLSFLRMDKEYFLFLMITILFLLVENMFRRHKGVVSYALFNSLFVFVFTSITSKKKIL